MKVKTMLAVAFANVYLFLNSVALKAGAFDIEDPLAGFSEDDYMMELTPTQIDKLEEFLSFAMISINGLAGVGLLTSVAAFTINAFRFSRANAKERADAINNMFSIAITTACLGSVPLLMYFVALIINM